MIPGRVSIIPLGEVVIDTGVGTVIGWGQIASPGPPADVLQFIQKPIISNVDCVGKWQSVVPITNQQICTFAGENRGT